MSKKNETMTIEECKEILAKLTKFERFLANELEMNTKKISLNDALKASYIYKRNKITKKVELRECLLIDEECDADDYETEYNNKGE